ncbi:MAG: hypothetical protein PHN31_04530 [Candidatus Gracilibacteria bacterium]|nr:hypothetical protein [Candidatus Gracilibacteria bacterium]
MVKKTVFLLFLLLGAIFSINLSFADGETTTTSTTKNADTSKDFSSTDFTINTNDVIGGMGVDPDPSSTLQGKFDGLLGKIINTLMISIGAVAMVVMSIGAGYMIIYNGQEELLTKGRKMFFSGILALVIALSSYYIVNLVRYILYN